MSLLKSSISSSSSTCITQQVTTNQPPWYQTTSTTNTDYPHLSSGRRPWAAVLAAATDQFLGQLLGVDMAAEGRLHHQLSLQVGDDSLHDDILGVLVDRGSDTPTQHPHHLAWQRRKNNDRRRVPHADTASPSPRLATKEEQ